MLVSSTSPSLVPYTSTTAPSSTSTTNTDTERARGTMPKAPVNLSGGVPVERSSNGILFTRDAQFIEHDNELYRVKNPYYTNYVAAEEVVMGNLFSMTGLGAPKMMLCNGCEGFFDFNKATRGDFSANADLSKFACVASKVEPSFKDLGTFLLDTKVMPELLKAEGAKSLVSAPAVKKVIDSYHALVQSYNKADSRLEDIYQAFPDGQHRQAPGVLDKVKAENLIKFSVLEKLNDLLPPELKQEQQQHYFASRLINNWDYLNFSFCNFGYFQPDTAKDQYRGMTVDFGGSGTLGFGGLSKAESFERATQGARPENPLQSTSLFERKDSTFSSDFPPSLTGISTIPRSRPLLSTIKDMVKTENDIYEAKNIQSHEKALGPALEVAYRLSVLPEPALQQFFTENWVAGGQDFPYRDKSPEHNVDTQQMTTIMADRKNAFIDQFGRRNIERWEANNPERAAQARAEVEHAVNSVVEGKYEVRPLGAGSQTI